MSAFFRSRLSFLRYFLLTFVVITAVLLGVAKNFQSRVEALAPFASPATSAQNDYTGSGTCSTSYTCGADWGNGLCPFQGYGQGGNVGSCGCSINSPGSCATCGARCGGTPFIIMSCSDNGKCYRGCEGFVPGYEGQTCTPEELANFRVNPEGTQNLQRQQEEKAKISIINDFLAGQAELNGWEDVADYIDSGDAAWNGDSIDSIFNNLANDIQYGSHVQSMFDTAMKQNTLRVPGSLNDTFPDFNGLPAAERQKVVDNLARQGMIFDPEQLAAFRDFSGFGSPPVLAVPPGYAFCGDFAADIESYNGCAIPGDTSTKFWVAPQAALPEGDIKYATQTCGNMVDGGCGGLNGCGNEDYKCSDAMGNVDSNGDDPGNGQVLTEGNFTSAAGRDTCRVARDGAQQCGGNGACGKEGCGKNYVKTVMWQTNECITNDYDDNPNNDSEDCLGFNASDWAYKARNDSGNYNTQVGDIAYKMCDLETSTPTARTVCGITPGTDGGVIACRCGQEDVCGLARASNYDAKVYPADLKITSLEHEEPVLVNPTNDPNQTIINKPAKHRFVVKLDLSDTQRNHPDREEAILYTRLIEVCMVNLASFTGSGSVSSSHLKDLNNFRHYKCAQKRVDGQAELFLFERGGDQAAIKIEVDIDEYSQGPWTVAYRAINDVCNRTFGDWGPELTTDGNPVEVTGATPQNRLNVIGNNPTTGVFGGIQEAGNMASFNLLDAGATYCHPGVAGASQTTALNVNAINVSDDNIGAFTQPRSYSIGYNSGRNYQDDNQKMGEFIR